MEGKSKKKTMQNRSKKRCILESIFGRILVDFWWKMEVCWHQNRSKIDPNFEKRFFEKTSFSLRNYYNFEDSGDRSWREIRWKIDQKMKPTWEGILTSIFHRFWWVLGPKLGRKIHPRRENIGVQEQILASKKMTKCKANKKIDSSPPKSTLTKLTLLCRARPGR